MAYLVENRASSKLASAISSTATSVVVQTSDADLFPSPTGSDSFFVTLRDAENLEIAECTSRSGATLTVTRGQDGTTAYAFAAGAVVELRATMGFFSNCEQKSFRQYSGNPNGVVIPRWVGEELYDTYNDMMWKAINATRWKNITGPYWAVETISCGGLHTLGLLPNGTVIHAGNNTYGEGNVSSWENVVSVAAGTYFSIGLKSNGTCYYAGTTSGDYYDLPDIIYWEDVISIRAGGDHCFALKNDGTVLCAGYSRCTCSGFSGYLIKDITAGNRYCSALLIDDSLWWYPAATNIKNISGSFIGVAVAFKDGTCGHYGNYSYGENLVSSWTDVIKIKSWVYDTYGVKSDGTVLHTGLDDYGQATIVAGWTDIIDIFVGSRHVVGVKSDGTLVSGGDNTYGQCNVTSWSLS